LVHDLPDRLSPEDRLMIALVPVQGHGMDEAARLAS
jgi:hypothetical protein